VGGTCGDLLLGDDGGEEGDAPGPLNDAVCNITKGTRTSFLETRSRNHSQ
jgi:hypothetical protein